MRLTVSVISAQRLGLQSKNESFPYVCVEWQGQAYYSEVLLKTLSPKWQRGLFSFPFAPDQHNEALIVSVYNQDQTGRHSDVCLGTAVIDLYSALPLDEKFPFRIFDDTLPLEHGLSSEATVRVQLAVIPDGVTRGSGEDLGESMSGLESSDHKRDTVYSDHASVFGSPTTLSLQILEARDLLARAPGSDGAGHFPSAYCFFYRDDTPYSTNVAQRSINPKWNDPPFTIPVVPADFERPIVIEVRDYDVTTGNHLGSLGTAALDLSRITPGINVTEFLPISDGTGVLVVGCLLQGDAREIYRRIKVAKKRQALNVEELKALPSRDRPAFPDQLLNEGSLDLVNDDNSDVTEVWDARKSISDNGDQPPSFGGLALNESQTDGVDEDRFFEVDIPRSPSGVLEVIEEPALNKAPLRRIQSRLRETPSAARQRASVALGTGVALPSADVLPKRIQPVSSNQEFKFEAVSALGVQQSLRDHLIDVSNTQTGVPVRASVSERRPSASEAVQDFIAERGVESPSLFVGESAEADNTRFDAFQPTTQAQTTMRTQRIGLSTAEEADYGASPGVLNIQRSHLNRVAATGDSVGDIRELASERSGSTNHFSVDGFAARQHITTDSSDQNSSIEREDFGADSVFVETTRSGLLPESRKTKPTSSNEEINNVVARIHAVLPRMQKHDIENAVRYVMLQDPPVDHVVDAALQYLAEAPSRRQTAVSVSPTSDQQSVIPVLDVQNLTVASLRAADSSFVEFTSRLRSARSLKSPLQSSRSPKNTTLPQWSAPERPSRISHVEPSGHKKALLIGCSYPALPLRRQLLTASNDIKATRVLAVHHIGIPDVPKCFTVLDDGCTTKETILDALDWLADGAERGDVLLFYFSGYRALDASDLDTVMVAEDGEKISKKEMLLHLQACLPEGCRLTCLFDYYQQRDRGEDVTHRNVERDPLKAPYQYDAVTRQVKPARSSIALPADIRTVSLKADSTTNVSGGPLALSLASVVAQQEGHAVSSEQLAESLQATARLRGFKNARPVIATTQPIQSQEAFKFTDIIANHHRRSGHASPLERPHAKEAAPVVRFKKEPSSNTNDRLQQHEPPPPMMPSTLRKQPSVRSGQVLSRHSSQAAARSASPLEPSSRSPQTSAAAPTHAPPSRAPVVSSVNPSSMIRVVRPLPLRSSTALPYHLVPGSTPFFPFGKQPFSETPPPPHHHHHVISTHSVTTGPPGLRQYQPHHHHVLTAVRPSLARQR